MGINESMHCPRKVFVGDQFNFTSSVLGHIGFSSFTISTLYSFNNFPQVHAMPHVYIARM